MPKTQPQISAIDCDYMIVSARWLSGVQGLNSCAEKYAVMRLQILAVKLAVAIALTLSLASFAFAQDMKGMDMSGEGGMDMSKMSGTMSPDPSNMKEGEMEAMSGGPEMDHDMHMGHGSMKNMSKHMAYTALRPETAADKTRATSVVNDLQHALAKYK